MLQDTVQAVPFGTLDASEGVLPGATHAPPPLRSTSPVLQDAVAFCDVVDAVTIRMGGSTAAGPRGPGGPIGPCAPTILLGGPGTPAGPAGPGGPAAPCAPASPGVPIGPVTPAGP
jgi:hypothetical protein